MTTTAPTAGAISHEAACRELRAKAGTSSTREVVEVFLAEVAKLTGPVPDQDGAGAPVQHTRRSRAQPARIGEA